MRESQRDRYRARPSHDVKRQQPKPSREILSGEICPRAQDEAATTLAPLAAWCLHATQLRLARPSAARRKRAPASTSAATRSHADTCARASALVHAAAQRP
eukprot:2481101-Pleurochrysis_carterae.AAC.2